MVNNKVNSQDILGVKQLHEQVGEVMINLAGIRLNIVAGAV